MNGVTKAIFRSMAFAGALGALVAGPAARADVIEWSDTSAGIRYGVDHREPANPNDITKAIIQLQHVHGWTYGQTFLAVDILKGTDEDEEAADDGGPATEIYAVLREKLSSAKIFGASYGGVIRDIGLTIGGDVSYDDDAFHGRVRKFVVGPTIDFEVPGFLSIGLLLGTEHNYNGIVNTPVDFDPTWRIETAWGLPVPLDIGVPMTFKGYMNIVGPKGTDGFGNDTVYEILLETALMFDVGTLLDAPKSLQIGFGYQWWRNKYGNDPKITTFGTEASVPQFVAEFHF